MFRFYCRLNAFAAITRSLYEPKLCSWIWYSILLGAHFAIKSGFYCFSFWVFMLKSVRCETSSVDRCKVLSYVRVRLMTPVVTWPPFLVRFMTVLDYDLVILYFNIHFYYFLNYLFSVGTSFFVTTLIIS